MPKIISSVLGAIMASFTAVDLSKATLKKSQQPAQEALEQSDDTADTGESCGSAKRI
ncbi:hypothetical protein [Xanthomonas fragariae]|uniref:hypothetical protein n=1 Tax=Xanthomonas fragariae TaxID=48664 RepID=UPI001ABDBB83|nr:hypothetical protein [Xanthomonas fragariae]UKR54275.1 hypothetical protein K4A87_15155 [Xanthomonas fragariae]